MPWEEIVKAFFASLFAVGICALFVIPKMIRQERGKIDWYLVVRILGHYMLTVFIGALFLTLLASVLVGILYTLKN